MRTDRLFAIGMLTALAGCEGLEGNGVRGESIRILSSFYTVRISGGLSAEITIDESANPRATTVVVSGDSNLLPRIVTRVENGGLVLAAEQPLRPQLLLLIEMTVPVLRAVNASGSSQVEVHGISAPRFEVEVSGSSGAVLVGAADRIDAHASGSAVIDARHLSAREVKVAASGSTRVAVCADLRLDAEATGSADIDYYCDPLEVRAEFSGSAGVRRR